MLQLHKSRRKIDLDPYRLRSAAETDYKQLIDEPFILYDEGHTMVAYLYLDDEAERKQLDAIYAAMLRIQYTTSFRPGGLKTTSRVFGYMPRNSIRRDFCTSSSLAYEQGEEHAIVASGSEIVDRHYKQVNPELYSAHRRMADQKVRPEWRLKDAPFTSGIINENNPLMYHFDQGNFAGVWSGQLTFKQGIEGGYLAMPEYDLAIELRDHSLLLFDGQGILHGVTPIRRLSEDSKRYTVVYYSLRGMWQCEPLDQEVRRIRTRRTDREARRAGRTV